MLQITDMDDSTVRWVNADQVTYTVTTVLTTLKKKPMKCQK